MVILYVCNKIRIIERLEIGGFFRPGVMVMTDSVVRRIPGFIGNADSAADDSFAEYDQDADTRLLGPPVYTRPAEYRGLPVPEVLISGHHANVKQWRCDQALAATKNFRPEPE